jgi:hypothetical protein
VDEVGLHRFATAKIGFFVETEIIYLFFLNIALYYFALL